MLARPFSAVCYLAGLILLVPSVAAAEEITPGKIGTVIERAADWLIRQQNPDGTWQAAMRTDETVVGATSLVVLALANAGVPADDPAMQKALDWIRRQEPKDTYSVSLQTQALAMVSPQTDLPILERNVRWLEDHRIQRPPDPQKILRLSQEQFETLLTGLTDQDIGTLKTQFGLFKRNLTKLQNQKNIRPDVVQEIEKLYADAQIKLCMPLSECTWSYGTQKAGGDNSNAQFAVLALHEASIAGVKVDRSLWLESHRHWTSSQNNDGSWGYTAGGRSGTGSMTCAGISSIAITNRRLVSPDAYVDDEQFQCCGGGSSPKPLEQGLRWLARNFSVTENPSTGSQTWLFYYLYGLERVGRFTARRFIGTHDWYLEGAEMFVKAQDQLSGNFRNRGVEDPVVATSFALLFLAKGRRPVVIAKSRHGPRDDWNQHGHDIAHLVDFVEQRWKEDYPAGLSWHVVETETATGDDLAQAPVLWIGGKSGLNLGPEPGRKLRQYIDRGGFIFAEPACPEGEEFDKQFRQLVTEIFPEPEYQLNLLPPEHPAWHAEQLVPPNHQRPLLGVDYGCRTCLIYAPPGGLGDDDPALPSLSCLWELAGPYSRGFPENVREQIDAAIAIGANVIAYATNRELKNKDELFAAEKPQQPQGTEIARGQLTIGKLKHGGLCDAAPAALANILRAAARELGVRVDDTPALLDLIDPQIFRHHMLFMHGRQAFAFDGPQRANLQTFLKRGGTLLADSVCAAAGFTEAFRREISLAIPDRPLEPIPVDDPLFSAADSGGYDLREVTIREPAGGNGPLAARKRKVPPKLEGIRIDDRWAVIFSPYDISCALEKQNSMECTGYDRDDAEKIALNVLLYSLNK